MLHIRYEYPDCTRLVDVNWMKGMFWGEVRSNANSLSVSARWRGLRHTQGAAPPQPRTRVRLPDDEYVNLSASTPFRTPSAKSYALYRSP
jgi:hypothetical protein